MACTSPLCEGLCVITGFLCCSCFGRVTEKCPQAPHIPRQHTENITNRHWISGESNLIVADHMDGPASTVSLAAGDLHGLVHHTLPIDRE